MQPARLPWWMRAIDVAHARVQRTGLPVVSLDPDDLLRAAARRTGEAPPTDGRLRRRLGLVCRSVEHEAHLNFFGRLAVRRHLIDAIVTRTRLERLERESPEVFETSLNDPVIVIGSPRSGTTHLHRMLNADPEARAYPIWELRHPIPGPGPDRRREKFVAELQRVHRMVPGMKVKHEIGADEPEECMYLCDPSLSSLSFWVNGTCFEYLEDYRRREQWDSYEVYRKLLQVLQHRDPDRRLTLKAPAHTAQVEALRRAVPEAHLVQTHRDPVEVAPSLCSLLLEIQAFQTRAHDVRRAVATDIDLLEWLLDRNHEQRARLDEPIFDVMYADLVADPLGVVRSIYERFDLPWSPTVQTRVEEFVAEHPQHKHGKHRYAPEDFGLTAEEIERRFAAYRERWGFA